MALSALLFAVLAAHSPITSEQLPGPQPIRFVQNLGQTDPAVRFTARNGALDAWLTDDALLLRLCKDGDGDGSAESSGSAGPAQESTRSGVVLRLRFDGAPDSARVVGEQAAAGVVHSYRGEDSARWVAAAPVYSTLRWQGVAEGVDVRLLERDGRLAYDLLLEPGADLSRVVLACEGAERLELIASDRLLVHTTVGPLEQVLPAAWEIDGDGREIPVRASFRLLDGMRFGFQVEGRNAARALVIDPGLDYGTFYGGSLLDEPTGVAFAPDGDLVVVGTTGSQGLPTTPGAYQDERAGNNDAFVARLDATTGQLVYATFFGGADVTTFEPEGAQGLAVSADGSVTVVGRSESAGFPTTPGVVGQGNLGGANGFVARFSASGGLLWSTLVGGSKKDTVTAVAVDGSGRTTIVGITFSDDFPVTPGAYDETFNSIFFTNDAFVARLSADATSLDYATFVGGSLRDEALEVALAADGSAVVTGLTGSSDFPSTSGAYDAGYNGATPSDTDAFVLRLSPSGDALSWSTFLGGSAAVEGYGLALDAAGNPVVAGVTLGDDFPTTRGAFQQGFGGGASDAFLSKLSADGATLLWSTFLGGAGDDGAAAVALTNGGLPTVTGTTTSQDFPTHGAAPVRTAGGMGHGASSSRAMAGGAPPTGGVGSGPPTTGTGSFAPNHDNTLDGGQDAFLVRLSSDGGGMLYGTFYGGADTEHGVAVDVDGFGAALVAGGTWSADLTTAGAALDASYNGTVDTFLARWALPPFENLGLGTGGEGGTPRLTPHGSLEGGASFSLELSGAPAAATTLLFVSRTAAAVPFLEGVLVAWPAEFVLPLRTNADGALSLQIARWPSDVPPGAQLVLQAWTADAGSSSGAVASNALALLAP